MILLVENGHVRATAFTQVTARMAAPCDRRHAHCRLRHHQVRAMNAIRAAQEAQFD
jgi:hypothetical protein